MRLRVFVGVVFLFLGGVLCSALRADEVKAKAPEETVYLNMCSELKLGFKIKCNPDWQLETRDQSLMMIIKAGPAEFVTLTISRSKDKVKGLSELTRSVLQFLGQYEDFFKINQSTVGLQPAYVIKARAKDHPDIQLYDFYVVKNQYLYSIL